MENRSAANRLQSISIGTNTQFVKPFLLEKQTLSCIIMGF